MELEKAIQTLKKYHPYPEDIFIPLGTKGRKPYVNCILKAGLSVDRYSAELMRLSWINCVEQLELLLKEDKEVSLNSSHD